MSKKRSGGGPRPASAMVAKVMRRTLGRRGFAEADIILRWRAIAGDHLADRTAPDKLVFPRREASGAVLHLRVTSGAAPEVQHLAPLIVDKVNTYYGFRAVERLHLVQGPVPKRADTSMPERRALRADERLALDRQVAGTADPALRAALRSLGQSVLTQPQRRRRAGGGDGGA